MQVADFECLAGCALRVGGIDKDTVSVGGIGVLLGIVGAGIVQINIEKIAAVGDHNQTGKP